METRKKNRRSTENYLIFVLTSALFLRLFVISTTMVDGYSMVPTLNHNQMVLVNRLSYLLEEPQRFDVVVVKFPGEKDFFVKRVIGLPGEVVELRGREGIFVDGKLLPGDEYGIGVNPRTGIWEVPEGYYFIMGDNREHSKDSASLGPLCQKDITGKAVIVYWPIRDFKLI